MPVPFRPMLAVAATSIPVGHGIIHQIKLDGWRCCAEVTGSRVRIWTRGGREWSDTVPELAGLGDGLVVDGELVVVTADGRADFDLLAARMMNPAGPTPVSLYVFDLLRLGGADLIDAPWTARHAALADLDLVAATAGAVRTVSHSGDGAAMWAATKAVGGEGIVSKVGASRYLVGQRSPAWKKLKHRTVEWFDVVGWRPSTRARPGGLMVAEGDDPVGTARLALPAGHRDQLADLLGTYGQRHPTGLIALPDGAIQAQVRYTARTPTHRHLREAAAVALRPAQPADADHGVTAHQGPVLAAIKSPPQLD